MKKPSDYCKMENTGYLGHFYKAQYLDKGHNECEGAEDKAACRELMASYAAEDKERSESKESRYKGMSRPGGDFQRALDKRRGKY